MLPRGIDFSGIKREHAQRTYSYRPVKRPGDVRQLQGDLPLDLDAVAQVNDGAQLVDARLQLLVRQATAKQTRTINYGLATIMQYMYMLAVPSSRLRLQHTHLPPFTTSTCSARQSASMTS